ncbi:hypothetical protein HX785_28185 [Pseudomonas reactans]|uniref:hypothetical protein n=1 Tax=Pseudomonas reactans TaxID=117680 RepID=UPI0015A1938E|nr:hypothetical protein [Pseudomonas reactans]NWF17583.1 hypothetical protein [Pseudomonas reactans]
MLDFIKLFTLIVAAVLGVYGSFFNFRGKDLKVTMHGWFCVVGIVVCAVISGALQVRSDKQDEEKSLLLLRQNNLLMENVNRNLTPLSPLVVSFSLRPDLKLPAISEFLSSLERGMLSVVTVLRGASDFGYNPEGSSFGSQNMPPPTTRYNNAFLEATCSQDMSIIFFKSKIEVAKFNYFKVSEYPYDLAVNISNPCRIYDVMYKVDKYASASARLSTVFLKGKAIDAYAKFDPVTVSGVSDEWRGNGQIVSILDLLNTTMVVQLYNYSSDWRKGFTAAEVGRFRRQTNLIELSIKLPNGALLEFDEDNLVKYFNSRGEPFYVFEFPGTVEDLLKFTKGDSMKLIRKVGFLE